MPMVWTPMACPFAHFSLNGTVLRQHPQRCLWGTLTIKLYIEMCVKIKTLPKQNCFKVMHLSLSIMDNEGSMLKEDFTSPNIDHICCVPGHTRTTGNTLRTWGKFLRSLTHFASIFVKFWRTLKSPRRWGCSSFFNFPCRHGKRLHVWYFFTFFFFFISPFPSFLLGSYFTFLLLLEVSVWETLVVEEVLMHVVLAWVKEREIISCAGRDSGMGNVQSATGKIISVMGSFLLLSFLLGEELPLGGRSSFHWPFVGIIVQHLFLFLSWDGPCFSCFKLYTYNLDVSSVLCWSLFPPILRQFPFSIHVVVCSLLCATDFWGECVPIAFSGCDGTISSGLG